MSKLTIGVMSGIVLAAAVAVPSLASSSSSSAEQQPVSATAAPTSAPKAVAKAVATTKTTTAKVTVAKVTPPVPAPAKQTPNPDVNSKACQADRTLPYCSVNSVRYVLKGTPVAVHNLWLPVLTKWGVTDVSDTCVTTQAKALGTDLCVVRASHGTQSVTVLFKTVFDDRYSPAAVQKQSDAIKAKALVAAQKATTPAAKAKILDAANAAIDKLQAAADKYNAKNPKTSVNVVVA